MAYQNRTFEQRTETSSGADLYHYEVLIAYWKLPGKVYRDSSGKRRSPGSQHFTRSTSTRRQVDPATNQVQLTTTSNHAQFNTARAALSRAARRLRDRGLVHWVSGAYALWAGINLTSDGVALAEQLQDNG